MGNCSREYLPGEHLVTLSGEYIFNEKESIASELASLFS